MITDYIVLNSVHLRYLTRGMSKAPLVHVYGSEGTVQYDPLRAVVNRLIVYKGVIHNPL